MLERSMGALLVVLLRRGSLASMLLRAVPPLLGHGPKVEPRPAAAAPMAAARWVAQRASMCRCTALTACTATAMAMIARQEAM
jgi:hypothetical protein